ncbi:MAG: hypothetical protein WCV91_04980 [Candidatus Margulisiibacteriota bacterium]
MTTKQTKCIICSLLAISLSWLICPSYSSKHSCCQERTNGTDKYCANHCQAKTVENPLFIEIPNWIANNSLSIELQANFPYPYYIRSESASSANLFTKQIDNHPPLGPPTKLCLLMSHSFLI